MNVVSKLENIYLNLLRYIIIIAATLSLIALAYSGLKAFAAYMSSEPAKAKQIKFEESATVKNTNMALEIFNNEQIAESASQPSPSAKSVERQPQKEDKYQTHFKESADKVTANLIQYVQVAQNRPPVNAQKMLQIVSNLPNQKGIHRDNEVRKHYWDTLVLLTDSLVKQAEDHAKNPQKRVDLDKLVNWHASKILKNVKSFVSEVDEEENKQSNLRSEYLAKKAAIPTLLIIAGSSLIGFLTIILIFVMVRIERNLRPLQKLADTKDSQAPQ